MWTLSFPHAYGLEKVLSISIFWQKATCDQARFDAGVNWVEFEPDTLLRELVEYLAAKKYSQPAFNQKR